MKFLKNIFILFIGALFGLAIAFYAYKNYVEPKTITDSTVLLSNIKKVAKLVTAEAEFSNVFDHKEYRGYDWFPFQKKAILKVNAKVAAGVDLQQIEFVANETLKVLTIKKIPSAEILRIETDVKYYDISEGIFNSFSEEELTEINRLAKEVIHVKAYNSEVMQKAEEKALEILEVISLLVKSYGWEIEMENLQKKLD